MDGGEAWIRNVSDDNEVVMRQLARDEDRRMVSGQCRKGGRWNSAWSFMRRMGPIYMYAPSSGSVSDTSIGKAVKSI